MKKLLSLITTLLIAYTVQAQIEAPVKWSYGSKKISNTETVIFLKANIQKDWHIYSAYQKDGGPIKTSFTFAPSKEYTLVGKISEPPPLTKFEKSFSINVTYFENSVVFQQKIKLKSPKATNVKGKLEFMVCNDKKCLPPEEVEFDVALAK